jgi:hypothetical protein
MNEGIACLSCATNGQRTDSFVVHNQAQQKESANRGQKEEQNDEQSGDRVGPSFVVVVRTPVECYADISTYNP